MPRVSIERRVPLMASLLVIVVASALTVASYREVRGLVESTLQDRVARRAHDLADAVGRSFQQRKLQIDSLAASPAVRAFARARGRTDPAPARKALRSRITASASQDLTILDPAGHVLLSTDTSRRPSASEDAPPTPGATPLYMVDTALGYRVAHPIVDGTRTLGWLVERRRVSFTEESRRSVRQLIGGDAHVFYGNRSGNLWADLGGRLPGPPDSVALGEAFTYQTPNDGRIAAAAFGLAGTPWAILIGLPEAQATATIGAFLRRIALIAVALALLASVVAWWMSRRITQPLRQVSEAATALAAGDLNSRSTVRRDDEVGDLSRAFNTMAARVEESTHELERQVADRTAQLQRQVVELEEVNRELETFSYSVSHDLRAPLRAIDGFSRILQTDHEAALDPDARRQLGIIRQNAQRMGALVDDLLRLSRLGRQAPQPDAVDMEALANDALDDVRREGPAAAEVHVQPLPRAWADAALVRQVWSNLLANALKYAGKREVPRVEVGAAEGDGNGEAVYFVKDNGVGFDQKYADKLFGVFQRLHRNEEFEGTGVGLAIVQRIVHRHGGRVWAEAQPDRGATFYFTLPTPGPGA